MNEVKLSSTSEHDRILNLLKAYDNYIGKNNYINALFIANKLVEIRGHVEDWIAQALCQTSLGNFSEAVKSYFKLIDIDDSNLYAWANLGCVFNIIGMYNDALICLEHVIELGLEPGSHQAKEVLVNLATVLGNLGRPEESLVIFDRIVQVQPVLAITWLNRGLTLHQLGRYEEALCSFDCALFIEPKYEQALQYKGITLTNLSLHEKALALFDKALKINPYNSKSWSERGMALANTFDYSEALLSFDRSIELDERNLKAWLGKGIVLNRLDLYAEALTAFDKLAKEEEQVYSLLINRSIALLALKNWYEGYKFLKLALEKLSFINEYHEQATVQIVCNLFYNSTEQSEWQLLIKLLVKVYSKYSSLVTLAQGVTTSISILFSLVYSQEKIIAWRDTWQDITSNITEFEVLLRLLNVAVDYRETKGNPLIYFHLSKEEEDLFKSLLGVEKSPEPLDETQLIFDAGFVALSGYKFLGRGVVCFFGQKPQYLTRKENMPNEILALVDEYSPNQEFIVIPSNHVSAMLVQFDEIGIEFANSLSEEDYKQEVKKVLELLVQKGLNENLVKNIQQAVLCFRGVDVKSANHPPGILAFCQNVSQESLSGDMESLVNFLNTNLLND